MTDKVGTRTAKLAAMLREAGLAGKVQVGGPAPPHGVISLQHSVAHTPVGVEEESMDLFLHPSLYTQNRGRLIEIEGGPSTGRTALAYRVAAGATARGELVGWVDLPNALDPRSLRRTGIDLTGMLWIRPPRWQAALRAAELLFKTGFAVVVLDLEGAGLPVLTRGGPAIWSRLLRATRGARATALLLGTDRASGSFSSLGLGTKRTRAIFDRGLLEGLECSTTVLRNRTGPVGMEYPLHIAYHPAAAHEQAPEATLPGAPNARRLSLST